MPYLFAQVMPPEYTPPPGWNECFVATGMLLGAPVYTCSCIAVKELEVICQSQGMTLGFWLEKEITGWFQGQLLMHQWLSGLSPGESRVLFQVITGFDEAKLPKDVYICIETDKDNQAFFSVISAGDLD